MQVKNRLEILQKLRKHLQKIDPKTKTAKEIIKSISDSSNNEIRLEDIATLGGCDSRKIIHWIEKKIYGIQLERIELIIDHLKDNEESNMLNCFIDIAEESQEYLVWEFSPTIVYFMNLPENSSWVMHKTILTNISSIKLHILLKFTWCEKHNHTSLSWLSYYS